jgi:hypothetical protein
VVAAVVIVLQVVEGAQVAEPLDKQVTVQQAAQVEHNRRQVSESAEEEERAQVVVAEMVDN